MADTHYGPDIEAGARYLKGFPSAAAEPQDGITQADLDAAMTAADTIVEATFGFDYDMSGWLDATPPLVAMVWELLASARAVEFKDLRLGLPGDDDDGRTAAERLERAARALLEKVLHGRPERLHLRDTDGNVIMPRKNRSVTVPRAADATSDWF
jgi:hypothetical protein